MATLWKFSTRILQFIVRSRSAKQCFVTFRDKKSVGVISATCMCAAGGGLLLYVTHILGKHSTVHAFKPKQVKPQNLFVNTLLAN